MTCHSRKARGARRSIATVSACLLFTFSAGLPSCTDPNSPEAVGKNIRRTISHTALYTRDLNLLVLACYSRGFTVPLFSLSAAQIGEDSEPWADCYDRMVRDLSRIEENGQDLNEALAELGLLDDGPAARQARGVLSAFFGLFSKTSALKEKQRTLFLQVTDSLPAAQRTAVYEAASNKCPSDVPGCKASEETFFRLMREGKLDHAVLQMHSECSRDSSEDLWGYQGQMENLKATPNEVAAREIPLIAAEGAKLAVAGGQAALSGISLAGEVTGGLGTLKDLITSTDGASAQATKAGQTLPAYMQQKLLASTMKDQPVAVVSELSAGLAVVLTDLYVEAVLSQDPETNGPALLASGLSQLELQPDESRRSALGGNLEESLVVVTGQDLFSAGRVIVASADTEKNPLYVLPGSYELAVSAGAESAKVTAVQAAAGQVTTIGLPKDLWKKFAPVVPAEEETPEQLPDASEACAHFQSAWGNDGSCYTNQDFFTYCAESGPYYCKCVPFEIAGDGAWQVFTCQEECTFWGLGSASDCDQSSQRKERYTDFVAHMRETGGPVTTMLESCVCSEEFIPVDFEDCKWGTTGYDLATICAASFTDERDKWMKTDETVCVNDKTYACLGDVPNANRWTALSPTSCDDSDPATFDWCAASCTVGAACEHVPVAGVGDFHGDCAQAEQGKSRCVDTGAASQAGRAITVLARCVFDSGSSSYKIRWEYADDCEPSDTWN